MTSGLASMAAAAAVTAALVNAAPAAADDSYALNGIYTATSDGRLAKTNDVYRSEATVVSTWTISTTCEVDTCSGRVSSDQGWTADLRLRTGRWTVEHQVSNWESCPDGTSAAGRQKFSFEYVRLTGFDLTIGPSGACGINEPLVITMPFALVRR